jgi:hypothetical protein
MFVMGKDRENRKKEAQEQYDLIKCDDVEIRRRMFGGWVKGERSSNDSYGLGVRWGV